MILKLIDNYGVISNKINALKNKNRYFLSNNYLIFNQLELQIKSKQLYVYDLQNYSFILIDDSDNIFSLYYYLNHINDFEYTLQKQCKINVITKNIDYLPIFTKLIEHRFQAHSIFEKMILKIPSTYQPNKNIIFANNNHSDTLLTMYLKYFNIMTEYVPTKNKLQKSIDNKKIMIYIANEKIVGFLVYEIKETISILLHIAVDEEYRNQNIASNLMGQYFIYTNKKIKQYHLWVNSSNKTALNFYKKIGYNKTNIKNNVFLQEI